VGIDKLEVKGKVIQYSEGAVLRLICKYIDEAFVNDYYYQGWSVKFIKHYYTWGYPRGCFLASMRVFWE